MKPASRQDSGSRRGALSRRAFLNAIGVAAGASALQGLSGTAAASPGSIAGPQFYQVPPGTQAINFNIGASTPPPLRELEFAMCGDPTALTLASIVGDNGDRLDFNPSTDPIMGTLQSMENPMRTTAAIFTITVNNGSANNQPLAVGASYR